MKRAESLISACPACKENFFNTFCTLTCSPDQSLFVNVTDIQQSRKKKDVAAELDYVVSKKYGSGFYNSCKDVKFSATNGYVMDFIGGGAKNYTAFLKFLGDKKPFGSPFQIDFPPPRHVNEPMKAMDHVPKRCNDTDVRYRCACVDCPSACPALPALDKSHSCHVGVLPCLSFAVILIYSLLLLLLVAGVVAHALWANYSQRKSERTRLLQDDDLSDDEDDGHLVANAGYLAQPEKHYSLNSFLDRIFSQLGRICARYPGIIIGSSIFVAALLSLGWINFAVETSVVRLWISPTSAAAEEKAFFDEKFGPFYRIEQAILTNETHADGPAPVLSYETLHWWFDIHSRVERLKSRERGVTLDNVCFKPTGDACVVESIASYFPDGFSALKPDTWQKQLTRCAEFPIECLPTFQKPIRKQIVFGGWEKTGNVLDAKALITTWVVNNHAEGSSEEKEAMDWEESLKGLLLAVQAEAKEKGLRFSFSTEISLEQELNKSSNTDAKIVVVSYVIMFLYASLALGSTTAAIRSLVSRPATLLVQSKFTLGIFGIIIVLMSVSASVGLFSALGIKVTLIIAEVIPFLVLAIGVDNIFLIVHEFERVNNSYPEYKVEDRVSKALGRIGPSILLSATTETVAFALGAAVGMPAVRNFAAYAAGAVLINALLQVTMFVAVLTLNQRRVEAGRSDCVPCIKIKGSHRVMVNGAGLHYEGEDDGILQKFIRQTYAPTLLGRGPKVAILVVFSGLFAAGLSLLPYMALGLDQRNALPSDSYLIPYFNDQSAYFDAGPPLYFVTRELNVTKREHQQQLCGRFSTCEPFSLTNVLEQERKRSAVSFVAEPAASWIDDYFMWLSPALDECCTNKGTPCFEDRQPPWNITLYGMPEGQEFIDYMQRWIVASPDSDCPVAGKAAYSNAVVIDEENLTIPASHFRTSHTPIRSQADFIAAYASARRIADAISSQMGIEVFPYSVFYVFFDQYLSIVRLAAALLTSAMVLILIITSIFLGSVKTGLVITVAVAMIVIDVMGAMVVTGVSLNAVSLVNLVICVGIGVEFCAHIARAFMFPNYSDLERAKAKFRGRDARAWLAMVNVGGSVFTGITLTKLLGVCVLAFTRSKIFEIYYFRVWLALVLFAASHALIFLPVALSLFGGQGKRISYSRAFVIFAYVQ